MPTDDTVTRARPAPHSHCPPVPLHRATKGTAHLEAAVRLAGNNPALKAYAIQLGMIRFIAGDMREALAELEASVEALDMLTAASWIPPHPRG